MAQAISNTSNPYSLQNLIKPMPVSTAPTLNKAPLAGIGSGPNQNMSPYTPPTAGVMKPSLVGQKPAAPLAVPPAAPLAAQNNSAPGTSAGQPIQQTIPGAQTGNVQTPSGAYVNATSGSLIAPPPQQSANVRGLFPDIVSSLAGRANYTNPMISESYGRAQDLAEQLKQSRLNQAEAQKVNSSNPIPIGDQEGRGRILEQQYLQQQNALTGQLQSESQLAGIGQGVQTSQQSALGTAGGLASPSVTGYGQTTFNPLTGQFGGGQGGGSFNPQTQAQQLAQEVASGSRTYADAISAMGYAGNAGQTFLNDALRQVSPGFNFSQAQALGQVQGQVAPQLQMAQKAIENLSATFNNTPWFQKTGVPLANTLSNMIAQYTGYGLGTETSKQNAIKEGRTQVANALGVMTNTTPTAWTNTVESWFPDNATPDQITAGVQQFTNLAGNRQQIYGAPGQVTPFTAGGGSTGGGFSW